ncbi:MAG TPA: FxSxx-COOH system tetratricopeptide repeat protein [Ktedonobacteraceae bacterium]|nr:FxSxx-COOH system tetratricopeptide repeat protein [Ktedonobacteraceae bacterium]
MDVSHSASPNYRLRQERIRRNWRQQELADLLGIAPVTVSRWEGGTQQPSLYYREKLCAFFGKSPEELGLVLEKPILLEGASVWNVPFPRNPFFTGRDWILTHLHTLLTSEPTFAALTQAYSFHGLGGIGKTQLAVEYAYQYHREYDAVLWVEAETQTSLTSSFMALAEVLALPEQAEEDQNKVVAAVQRWFNKHQHWLLIFDNVEDITLLKPFLPVSNRGAMLLTTRLQTLGTLAQRMELPLMTMQEGSDFLLTRTSHFRHGETCQSIDLREMAAAQQIVTQMGGLPLALEQVGAYIEATRCSLSDYLSLFQVGSQRLLAEHGASRDHPLSVSRTFLLAFERLEQRDAAAADLLTACAFLAPEAIPETLFLEGASSLGATFEMLARDRLAFEEAIKVLLSYSLIQRDASMHTLTIHRLVQVVLKGRLSSAERSGWSGRIAGAMTRLFPSDEDTQTDYWRTCEQLLSHALVCLNYNEHEDKPDELALPLMSHVAIYLTKRARYTEAEPLFTRVVQVGEHVLGPQHSVIAEALNGSGRLRYEQGKDELAESLFLQSLHIWEQALGSDYPQVAYPLINLGNLYCQQGKYEQAEPLYERALRVREQALGPDHALVAYPLNNLGNLFYLIGKYEQAEPLYERALRIREQALGPDHPQLAYTLTCLGELYRQQRQDERAEALLERALYIWEQALGPDHPQLAYPLNNLGELYRQQGKYEQAEPCYEQALHIREQALGPDHPQLAYPLNNLGELYRQQGKYERAESLYRRASRIWEQALGPDHPQLAYPFNGLANLYRAQGQYEQAEPLYQRALSLRQRHLGPLHPDVGETLYDLACLRQMQYRIPEALSLFQQALVTRERSLGAHHPHTLKTRNDLLELFEQMKSLQVVANHDQVSEPGSVLLCACGCGRQIDISKSRGERRRFFSNACKQRFYRNALHDKRNTV